jgi:hypothetical protein
VTSVAVVACDHGLGHVRRCLLVSAELRARGAEVTLLAPSAAVERLMTTLELDRALAGLRVIDFASGTSPAALRAGDPRTVAWHERLPSLDAYDVVLVDTLPDAVEVRPDSVLLAQFLWHDVLEGVDASYRAAAAERTARMVRVLGSEPFAMPVVVTHPAFRPVGLFGRAGAPVRADRAQTGHELLVAGGGTGALHERLRALVDRLIAQRPVAVERLHVDATLMPDAAPSWVVPARHDAAMYERVTAAVVRPGLGTITELLASGATVWSTYEAGNVELAHNAAVLVQLGVGHDLGDGATLAADLRLPPLSRRVPVGLRFDGARDVADALL